MSFSVPRYSGYDLVININAFIKNNCGTSVNYFWNDIVADVATFPSMVIPHDPQSVYNISIEDK